jgi:hypothetical protein
MPGVSATLEAAAIDRHADRIGDSEVSHKARGAALFGDERIGDRASYAARSGARRFRSRDATFGRVPSAIRNATCAGVRRSARRAHPARKGRHARSSFDRSGLRFSVGGLIAALDGLTLLVGRASDSFDAHWAQRTPQLRSRRRHDGPRPLDLPFLHL